MSDFRDAVRSLLHARWFALGAVVTFALGIGVNVAVFSAVDRMTFRPLPYRDVNRLVVLKQGTLDRTQTSGTLPAMWVVMGRGHVAGIEDMAMADSFGRGYALTSEPGAESAVGALPVTFNMLTVLGVSPIRGRGFTEDDARANRRLVLISYSTWQRQFGGRDDVLQATVWQAGQPAEIIGVLPRGFIPPAANALPSYGLSLNAELMRTATPTDRADPLVVRLSPGATVASVEAAFAPIVAEYERQQPPPPSGKPVSRTRAVLRPIGESMFGYYRNYMWLVAGAAGLVLLIACVNLASLMLVRGRSREHETAVRVALGASTARVMRGAVLEALLLSVAGAAVGIGAMAWSNQALRTLLPTVFVSYSEAWYDPRVVGFSVLAATACALLAGLLPGLRLSKVDVLPVLKAVDGRTQAGRLRGGTSLLIVEAAIGVVLVTGAAMTARSLIGLMRTDLGFDPNGVYSVNLAFPWNPQESGDARLRQYNEALRVIRTLPGVRAAVGADVLPISGAVGNAFGGGHDGQRWQVTDQLVEAMGMRLIAGRTFSRLEVGRSADLAVLSEQGAALVWPGVHPRDVVGRILQFPGEVPREVVGVVSDVRSGYAMPPYPSIYVPVTPLKFRFMMFVAHLDDGATFPLALLRDRIRQEVGEPARIGAGPEMESLRAGLRDQRFRALLFTAFGAVGLVLSAVGLYAVTSFDVAARRREMGVRLALGALPADVMRQVLRESVRPVLVGVVAGVLVSVWAAKFLQTFLHQVDARDPGTYAVVGLTLVATAVMAAWIPARRAARTDPALVLKAQ